MAIIIESEAPAEKVPASRADEWAYILPMALFLAGVWVGGKWESLYVPAYIVRTIAAGAAIILLWRKYTRVAWTHLGWGVAFGVLVFFQWVAMELFIPYWKMSVEPYNIFEKLGHGAAGWSFVAVRWIGAAVVVPFMEELFWRDWLWRTVISPTNFRWARIGQPDAMAVIVVSLAFGLGVHIEWLSAIVCGLLWAWLLIRTKSLGACIVAHAVANFLLGVYVLSTGDWRLW